MMRAFLRLGCPVLLLCGVPGMGPGQQRSSTADLLQEFQASNEFWRQIEVAKAIVAAKDPSVLPKLRPWLTSEDRHIRGNAAFIFAGLGDSRGFDTIVAILDDRSKRPAGQGIAAAPSTPDGLSDAQIGADRYYAAHLLGDLRDARAVPILVPLLKDPQVSYIVPWSLGQIGARSAIQPLIQMLSYPDPSLRVLAIYALSELKATEALPELRRLTGDHEKCTFDRMETVSEAATAAIASLRSR